MVAEAPPSPAPAPCIACQTFGSLPPSVMPVCEQVWLVLGGSEGALLVLYGAECPDAKPSPAQDRKGSCDNCQAGFSGEVPGTSS